MINGFRSAMFLGLAIISSSASFGATAPAPVKQFPPKDECLSIEGYFDLRQKFEDVIKRRDAKALLAMVSPSIRWSFGADSGGKAGFAKQWKLETGKASPIWAELDQLERLGCFSQGIDAPTMPHVFGQDTGAQSIGQSALVLGPAVNLRAQPTTTSPSLRKINWEEVTTLELSKDELWRKVKTADGKTGYIRRDYLRGDLDYRISFERTDKGWMIDSFVAGD